MAAPKDPIGRGGNVIPGPGFGRPLGEGGGGGFAPKRPISRDVQKFEDTVQGFVNRILEASKKRKLLSSERLLLEEELRLVHKGGMSFKDFNERAKIRAILDALRNDEIRRMPVEIRPKK